jgi:RNA polymerase sigma-70 factor (ECF subfamily)
MDNLQAPEPEPMGAYVISIRDRAPVTAGLVHRARDGDMAAYERLYHRHVGGIYGLCLRMTANTASAEDLTQQTFVRAWERLRTFRGEDKFLPWLRRIAVNVVLSDRRYRSRRFEQQVEEIEALNPPASTRSVHAGGELDLEMAISSLPARAREVFVLHDVEGHRHEEIAGMLDIAPGTSKSQLHRARKLLREALMP